MWNVDQRANKFLIYIFPGPPLKVTELGLYLRPPHQKTEKIGTATVPLVLTEAAKNILRGGAASILRPSATKWQPPLILIKR